MKRKINRRFDVVIFDIDNVLVDTRYSYADCIRETVQNYLERFLHFKSSKSFLLSRADVEQFKLLGGFNDDWDTCYGLLLYLLNLERKENSIADLKKRLDLKNFSKKIKPPAFAHGVERICGKHPKVSLVRIKGLFQKLYWSKYIDCESPVVSQTTFQKLVQKGVKIGIATGRNRKEANYVLKRFDFLKWIGKMVTVDSLPRPKFKKPHPFALFEIGKTFGSKLKYLYVGDLPDDMRMAKDAARHLYVTAVGFNYFSTAPKKMAHRLKEAGAQKIITKPADLEQFLKLA